MVNQGKQIRILKELPKEVVQTRKNYKMLIEKLISDGVRYRWQIPEGLSFMWKRKRILIKSVEQMDFLSLEGKRTKGEQVNHNGD